MKTIKMLEGLQLYNINYDMDDAGFSILIFGKYLTDLIECSGGIFYDSKSKIISMNGYFYRKFKRLDDSYKDEFINYLQSEFNIIIDGTNIKYMWQL